MDLVGKLKSVLGLIQIPINLVRVSKVISHKLGNKLESLRDDLDIIKGNPKIYDELQLMELVHDIEDFAQGLWIPGATGPFLSAIAIDPRENYLKRIDFFREKIGKLKPQQESTESRSVHFSSSSAAGGFTPEESLVGISEAKNVLLDLLQEPPSSEQAGGQDAKQRPRVISIVGCHGVGKTALARVVYEHARRSDNFECVVWVEATGCNDKTALLAEIQAGLASTLVPPEADGNNAAASPDLHGILADKTSTPQPPISYIAISSLLEFYVAFHSLHGY